MAHAQFTYASPIQPTHGVTYGPGARRTRLGALTIAMRVCACVALAGCADSSRATTPAAQTAAAPKDSADQLMYGINVDLTNQGASRAKLHADVGYVYDDGTRVELERVNVTFLNATGIKSGTLIAARGTYLVNKSQVQLQGLVVVTGVDARELRTEQIVFDYATNKLSSDAAYVFNEKNPVRQSNGTGFESDPQLIKVTRPKTAADTKAPAERAPKK